MQPPNIPATEAPTDLSRARLAIVVGNQIMSVPAVGLGNAFGFQPLDSDLTAIAALTTTSYGRSLLTSVSAAALFASIKQDATETATGVVELATTTEAQTGTDTTRAITAAGLRSATREKLTGARTYYVRTDGSDSNTGLVNNAGGAFLTIQKAVDVVAALDISTFNVTIQVADGTYTGGLTVNGAWLGSGTVDLIGNTTTPANVIISRTGSNCILVTNYGRLTARGFKVTTTTSGIGVAAQYGGILTINGLMEYGSCVTAHIYAERSGTIIINSSYAITGNSPLHVQALSDGYIFNVTNTITLTGTPAFSTAFVKCDRMALVEFASNTFSGAATGTRYSATTGGGINTFGGGASYFPGNAAGAATAPGWYA